ncbi:MAG: hypothetical protein K8I29_16325 [Alphaproteobacteria bacterium]|uniref:histidine kinase n=1 Tax=Candidatus Nitrobium versatile TaxID=2884831 RepID=A0A953M2I3_9BACT|nr:hypothetical protein [Candidatus Nitrobium versatile]
MKKDLRRYLGPAGLLFFFLLPFTVLIYLQLHEINRWIDFTGKERLGIRYVGSLRGILDDLQKHRGMASAFLTDGVSFKEDLFIKQQQIEKDIKEMGAMDREIGHRLGTSARWILIKNKWAGLKEKMPEMRPAESTAAHTTLITDVIDMISYVGESSNLILDSEPVMYYLIDSIIDRLPQASERLGLTRAAGVSAAVHSSLSPPDRAQLIMHSGLIRSSMEAVEHNIQLAIQKRPSLAAQLEPYARDSGEAVHFFLSLLDEKLINAGSVTIRPEEYFSTGTNALKECFRLYDAVSVSLDRQLEIRSGKLVRQRNLVIAFAAATCGIFLFIFISFTRTLAKRTHAEKTLHFQVEFEKCIADTARKLINVEPDEIDAMMTHALRRIGEFDCVDRSYLFLIFSDGTMDNVYEWCAEEIESRIERLKGLPFDSFPVLLPLKHFETIHVPRIEDLPPGTAGDRESFPFHGVRSFIIVPLVSHGTLAGFLGFDSIRKERKWEERDITLLKIAGEIFTNVVERKRMEEELQEKAAELLYKSEYLEKSIGDLARSDEELKHNQFLLEELNRTLEQKVIEAVSESRAKNHLMLLQSRQAAMGEMIGNIAHQWRQPLNTLGLLIQDLRHAYRHGELNREYLDRSVDEGMQVIRLMSQTIDDFRNFFRPNKEREPFSLKETVLRSLSFVEASFRSNSIHVELVVRDEVEITGYPNEYAQVVLNILNNAKDILLERKIGNPRVTITLFREDGRSVVTIADNAGGIEKEIMGKIFNPYFTTKEQGKGTGIGLYMSKNIIEKNMEGKLSVRNTPEGAEFRIEV